jgi:hypothetical protein
MAAAKCKQLPAIWLRVKKQLPVRQLLVKQLRVRRDSCDSKFWVWVPAAPAPGVKAMR